MAILSKSYFSRTLHHSLGGRGERIIAKTEKGSQRHEREGKTHPVVSLTDYRDDKVTEYTQRKTTSYDYEK